MWETYDHHIYERYQRDDYCGGEEEWRYGMAIRLFLRKEAFTIEAKSIQVKQALKSLNLSPEAYLLVRGGELLNENDYLHDGEEIKIVAVISGGAQRNRAGL
jgi:sulfur carrier protein ThiS